jgi:hypothetical protein
MGRRPKLWTRDPGHHQLNIPHDRAHPSTSCSYICSVSDAVPRTPRRRVTVRTGLSPRVHDGVHRFRHIHSRSAHAATARFGDPYLVEPSTDVVQEEWYGWRPMTWDSLPIIGRLPKRHNGYLATGHNMLVPSGGGAIGVGPSRVHRGRTIVSPCLSTTGCSKNVAFKA